MGLEKVKQEILNGAREEAGKLAEHAKEEAKAIEKSAENQVRDYERMVEEDIEKSIEIMKRRELAAAELEVQKKALEAKNELIEAVFSEASKKLRSLGDKSREAHVKNLLGMAMNEMDVAVVRCNAKDGKFVSNYGGGSGGRLKVVASDDVSGGVIAESADGRLRVNYSYETMLEQVKSKVLIDVARILFGKQ